MIPSLTRPRVRSAQFGGNHYGTSKATIEEQTAKGKVVVLDIEMEGVKQIKATEFPARYVFIAPPSEEELERRLRGRATDSEESIQKRLAQARNELAYSRTPGVHDKIIVNRVRGVGCGVVEARKLTLCRIWRRPTRSWKSLSLRPSHKASDVYTPLPRFCTSALLQLQP